MKYASQRGTRDILPEETPVWQALERTCEKLFSLYNYREIRTPIFEATELFTRSIGEGTDIVTKEMYTFEDKGGRSITLRPEETAPVVRAALQNNLMSQDRLVKLWYSGPMFRYERPQAGRYRQFYQSGVEAFGSADPALDAEMIMLAAKIMERLGLKGIEVDINSVGCKKCKPGAIGELKEYLKANERTLCKDCLVRLEKNPLRVLDCKEAKCQAVIEKAPATLDSLCTECGGHFDEVKKWLDILGVKYRINKRLVRGLDYYTKTAFEVVSDRLGAQNAVCGGGRYDDLVEELGGKPTPAIGFAIGLDRLVEALKSEIPARPAGGRNPKSEQCNIIVYLATMGEDAKRAGFELLSKIRKAGFAADMDYTGKSLKSQMKEADRQKAKYALIIGDDELRSGKAVLKKMSSSEQEEIAIERIVERISEK